MACEDPFADMDVELEVRPRFLQGSVRLPSGEVVPVRLTWQAWEEATGQPGPKLPEVDDQLALGAAWLAGSDAHYLGRVVDGGFRLVTAEYVREARRLFAE